jgi:hypothetical protein
MKRWTVNTCLPPARAMIPDGDVVRAFVGGMPAGATCHAIKWELTLGTAEAANRWSLTAVYGVPPASHPSANDRCVSEGCRREWES